MQFHEPDEFSAAMASLAPASMIKIQKAMRILARSPLVDGADLLQETYLRVLRGTRRWPIGVEVTSFAIGTMKSIADEAREKLGREQATVISNCTRVGASHGPDVAVLNRAGIMEMLSLPNTPEDDLTIVDQHQLIEEWRRKVLETFTGDDDAQLLIEGLFDGQKGRQLQELTGLSDTAFASKQRKVRRGIEKLASSHAAQRRQA